MNQILNNKSEFATYYRRQREKQLKLTLQPANNMVIYFFIIIFMLLNSCLFAFTIMYGSLISYEILHFSIKIAYKHSFLLECLFTNLHFLLFIDFYRIIAISLTRQAIILIQRYVDMCFFCCLLSFVIAFKKLLKSLFCK